ncbi:MAG: hypothetical protein KatS3mg110_3629 [Pirellulaceae bacterium]|nr:MAG: hypothetical protein KatS3mg110_3629 [Pirellulaceae bacterium]
MFGTIGTSGSWRQRAGWGLIGRIALPAIGMVGCLATVWLAAAEPIPYAETYALARDRRAALEQLVPGTEDYYYYYCLYYQQTEQFEKVEPLVREWIQRFGQTPRVRQIQHRQALLLYDRAPDQTLAYLRQVLNLRFDHQPENRGTSPDLPTRLAEEWISRERLAERALQQRQNLRGFEDSALEWLIGRPLSREQRRELLARLARPDYPGLVELLELDLREGVAFGAYPIHSQLLRDQLDELAKRRPELLSNTTFVTVYLTRLRPSDDVIWLVDRQQRREHLDRMLAFARTLPPSMNSLKAHLLYHRLVVDRALGQYDRQLFLEYLALPRRAPNVNPVWVRRFTDASTWADLNADWQPATGFPPPRDDEPLVRSYLEHFFVEDTNYDTFKEYLVESYLRKVFAETKIVNGLGDLSQWISWLSPAEFQQLKNRVDVDFAYTNREWFGAADTVHLDIFTKNVTTLIVNIYEINAFNYYRDHAAEIGTDLNLDGLTPNWQHVFQYEDPPLRRMARHLELTEITQPGTYVVDIIGNGKSSRALIRKGRLRYVSRVTEAGHLVHVLDEENRPLPDASVWLGGKEYTANQQGEIFLPFSTAPGRVPIILTHGRQATLEWFEHQAENYELRAGIYVDREALLRGRKAALVIRPSLQLNGYPVDLSVLEDVRLVVVAEDIDSVRTTQQVDPFVLHSDKDSVWEFQVPARLKSIHVTLLARVHSLSQNKKIDLAASQSFHVNHADTTDLIAVPHLTRASDGYRLEVFGRTGEPIADRPVTVVLKHRDFVQPVEVTMKTDPHGRIFLGPLPDIVSVEARVVSGATVSWPLRLEQQTLTATVHGAVGQVLEFPYATSGQKPTREEFSLLELRGNHFVADRFGSISIVPGAVRLGPLAAGDYDLLLKRTGQRVRIRISEAEPWNGHLLGQQRLLELSPPRWLIVRHVQLDEDRLVIKLDNVTAESRVHVMAVRYVPAFDEFAALGTVFARSPNWSAFPPALSAYVTGRRLGDEYRYILDRRYATKFPGNMLARPELLLNPWPVRSTQTAVQQAAQGEAFNRAEAGLGAAPAAPQPSEIRAPEPPGAWQNLDFLSEPSVVLLNLRPDADGKVTVARKDLGSHSLIRIVAEDRDTVITRTVLSDDVPAERVDLRLARALDPKRHFIRVDRVSRFSSGDTFVVDDIVSTRFEIYDSLSKVFSLYQTLSQDPQWSEFRFLLAWDNLSNEDKQKLYAKYACHELNFFLAIHDKEFFNSVVKPFLKNKKEKQFLDKWLLGEDVSYYAEMWQYEQLNTLERILLMRQLGRGADTARQLRDVLDVTPLDVQRWAFLFDTALGVTSLEASTELAAAKSAAEERKALGLQMGDARSAAPGAPGGFGGLGGFAGRNQMQRGRDGAEKAEALRENAAGQMEADKLGEQLDRAARQLRRAAVAERQAYQRLFQPLDATQEWAENHYFHLPLENQKPDLVPVRRFWADYAQNGQERVLSAYFPEASGNLNEMLLALAVLDLPNKSPEHDYQFEGSRLAVRLAGPALVFHQEVRQVEPSIPATPLLVSQNYFRHDDRYEMKNGRRVDKFVTGQFLVQTVYGCQVVVTNPTSSVQTAEVLLQIPQGALPLAGGAPTRTVRLQLEPFSTQTLEYLFYFPFPGRFPHFPVHVAQDEQLVGFAAPTELEVVERLSEIDRNSWDYVSQQGSREELLAFLSERNLLQVDLGRIAWRMKDLQLFQDVIRILDQRKIYHPVLWSYSVLHNVASVIRQYLLHEEQFISECGPYLDSPLVKIDPRERRAYEHLEYKPLVNARAHPLGDQRQILNDRLAQQYRRLMDILSCRRSLDDEDRLSVVYYLLLQDRIEEALAMFAEIHPEQLPTRIQYDYCQAYLAFYQEDIQTARRIASAYASYPVESWRKKFAAVAQQVSEIEGMSTGTVDPLDRDQEQARLAAAEPTFDVQLRGDRVVITYRNLREVQVNFYEMDIELLFSSNPFVQQFSGQFSYVRPNVTQVVALPADATQVEVPVPEALLKSNVLVEVTAAGRSRAVAYYSNSLLVQTVEGYGQLRVLEAASQKPLPRVYVKVYARMKDGQVEFYKDGYTDLRGRFDYATLSTNQLDNVERFALLILSDEHGAVVRELAPPKR